jgi:hypothetical protein
VQRTLAGDLDRQGRCIACENSPPGVYDPFHACNYIAGPRVS